MAETGMPWAYRALVRFGRLRRASSGSKPLHPANTRGMPLDPRGPQPNLLLSHPSCGVQRVIWLLHRPESVVGIEVSPQTRTRGCLHLECHLNKNTKVSRVVRHLHSLPFQLAGSAPASFPMVVHKNHLIGWCLDGAAAPLYTHTLDDLARLKLHTLRTLSPANAVLCCTHYEWDNWREVAMEPGWSHHLVDEHVANGLVSGQLTLHELRTLAAEVP